MSSQITEQLYQMRLFKKGEIHIFQNVIAHEIQFREDFIKIKYQTNKETGCFNVEKMKVSDLYSIEQINEPEYELKSSFPKEIKVKLY